MISHFFIDRPIFATVLSVVITLTGWIAWQNLPIAQYPQITPPAISVIDHLSGGQRQVVADTVAAPIEQQVTGVENMLYMSSQSGNDGSYSLSVTFDVGTNLNTALVMVQNRVMLAMPLLPTEVQNQGIAIRKRTPDILMIINLYSPDHRYDDLYLSNYALINLTTRCCAWTAWRIRIIFGERDYSIRAWLDPQKMAAMGINAGDVAAAIQSQNSDLPAGQMGARRARQAVAEIPFNALGRLSWPEEFGKIIVKAGPTASVPMTTVAPTPAAGIGCRGSRSPCDRGSVLRVRCKPPAHEFQRRHHGHRSPGPRGRRHECHELDRDPRSGGYPGTTSSGGGSTSGAQQLPPQRRQRRRRSAAARLRTGQFVERQRHQRRGRTPAQRRCSARCGLRPALSASATSPAWKWGPELQSGTDLRRSSIGGNGGLSTSRHQRPGRCRPREGKMAELRKRFPRGHRIRDRLRHHAVHPRVDRGRGQYLVRGRGTGGPGGAGLPAKLAGRADSDDRRARGHHRHVRGHGGGGFQLEQHLAVRAGAGDRHRGGRRHRGRGERRALAGTRPAPREAARRAMEEVTGPIIAMALVLCAVFVPCAFISGITGRFSSSSP